MNPNGVKAIVYTWAFIGFLVLLALLLAEWPVVMAVSIIITLVTLIAYLIGSVQE